MRVTPQAVVILNPARQLNHLQRAAEIHIQTLLFGLPVQGSGAVNQRVGRVHKLLILVSRKSKSLAGQIAAKNPHASGEKIAEFGKFKMQLERLPQALAGFLLALGTHQ